MSTWYVLIVIILGIVVSATNIDLANNTIILLLILLALAGTAHNGCCHNNNQCGCPGLNFNNAFV